MAIIFCEETKQFYLHTHNTSYVMELYEGFLAHSYWGKSVDAIPVLDQMHPFRYGADFSATDIPGRRFFSSDKLPQEYPTYGSADLREPALHLRHWDGNAITRLRYASHRILEGKPQLKGLPATYGESCQTLEITLEDPHTGLNAILSYTVFPEEDVLTRSVTLANTGSTACTIEKIASMSMDLHDGNCELVHLWGSWARERHTERKPLLHGTITLDSKRGASSHNENPFMALVRPDTTETTGDAYGFCLVYSGNFCAQVSVDQFNFTRVQMGIHSFDLAWQLAPGQSFQTPEVIMVYADQGIGQMSRRFHRMIRDNLCRGQFRHSPRPVLINNWEATYFNFDQGKILSLAEKAKTIGVDLMVLDDGWFGHRDQDNSSLGDWVVDKRKLPDGLESLCKKVNALGMQFGLWFEPEMISCDSDLYRAHPDWCIHVDGRSRTEGRRQLILDLTRREVCQYIIDAVCNVLGSCPISYVKWDMNRNMTELPRVNFAHEYMLGLYRVLEEITGKFPGVLFESCSGGGGRFDAGMLYYMPQIWTSDDTDAVQRLYIQEGTSLVYPLSSMGAHISAVPNHQVGRTTPVCFRSKVAMMGRFGLELDLGKLSQQELDILAQEIAQYKAYQQDIHQGEFYRLLSPYQGRTAAYEIVSNQRVLVFVLNISGAPNQQPIHLQLQGLKPDAIYTDRKGNRIQGNTLMNLGIPLDTRADYREFLIVFEIE